MEFPDLGKHCSLKSCSKLDFLPFVCDACKLIFCDEHYGYEGHHCPYSHTRNVTVPICPLCEYPIPVGRGEDPNIKVNEHISRDCEVPKKKKMYTNRCSHEGCKRKELIPVTCTRCHQNFCIQHRHEGDHKCKGPRPKYDSVFGNATPSQPSNRSKNTTVTHSKTGPSKPRQPQTSFLTQQGAELNSLRQARLSSLQQSRSAAMSQPVALSEDEALALAVANSLQDDVKKPELGKHPKTSSNVAEGTYNEDAALAQAIADSMKEQETKPKPISRPQHRTNRSQEESFCVIT